MIKHGLMLAFLLCVLRSPAQTPVLELTPSQIETLFIHQNLELIAGKLNVSLADAAIIQAKLWDNPTFSIHGLNFWSTESQREGQTIPPLFGSFGRNMQFSLELSQMISVSGKRAKLVNLEKVSREMALVQFEQLLQGLKLELRKLTTELLYLQQYREALETQSNALTELMSASQKQYGKGNLSKTELVRIQSALLDIENEKTSIRIELNTNQTKLKNLLSDKKEFVITLMSEEKPLPQPETISLSTLTEHAMEYRADLSLRKLQTQYYKESVVYEKSKRVPDISLSVGYDRMGGVWRDFVGLGVGIDLPVLNRNQGALKAAELSRQQSESMTRQQEILVCNEVAEVYTNYIHMYAFYQQTIQNKVAAELDDMLQVYTKNLLARNVSMIEYMDFLGTYKNTKQITLAVKRDVYLQLYDLEYIAAIYKNRNE